jgi:hypothetical protein
MLCRLQGAGELRVLVGACDERVLQLGQLFLQLAVLLERASGCGSVVFHSFSDLLVVFSLLAPDLCPTPGSLIQEEYVTPLNWIQPKSPASQLLPCCIWYTAFFTVFF